MPASIPLALQNYDILFCQVDKRGQTWSTVVENGQLWSKVDENIKFRGEKFANFKKNGSADFSGAFV